MELKSLKEKYRFLSSDKKTVLQVDSPVYNIHCSECGGQLFKSLFSTVDAKIFLECQNCDNIEILILKELVCEKPAMWRFLGEKTEREVKLECTYEGNNKDQKYWKDTGF